MKNYKLTELGFDTSYHNKLELLEVLNNHCKQYDDRDSYYPITNIKQAIEYCKNFGFELEICK